MRSSLLVLLMVVSIDAFAGPKVDIVVGKDAPALERLAADELASQLKRVYDSETQIAAEPPAEAAHVIFVGSPATNPALQPYAKHWPEGDKKLSDQGHLLRTITHRDRPALMIGGGSPVATFWAVAEYGHRLGIRVTLAGDLFPVAPPEFTLDGFDIVLELMEPLARDRAWTMLGTSPLGTVAWSLADQQVLLRQLAKLKFNRLVISVATWQPFFTFEVDGTQKQTCQLWPGPALSVTGDTAGRAALKGAKIFDNPDFASADTTNARLAVGTRMIQGLLTTAHELGMVVVMRWSPLELPKEFAAKMRQAQPVKGREELAVSPIRLQNVKDDAIPKLVRAQLKAVIDTYPEIDGIALTADVAGVLDADLWQSLREDRTWAGNSQRPLDFVRSLPPGTDHQLLREIKIPFNLSPENMTVLFGTSDINVLPQLVVPDANFNLWQRDLRQRDWEGASTILMCFGDMDFGAYSLSRMYFNDTTPPFQNFITPVCGEGVFERVEKAFSFADQVSEIMGRREQDHRPEQLAPMALLHNFDTTDVPPAWWNEVRDHYLNAMNEMYRANTRAREGGRAFTLYHARRFEFGYEYMNCVEAVRKAGIAARQKDTATEIAELEKAIESLHAGLNAMAAISRSQSDRAIIAVLNEYGYRPLKKKLAEAEATR